MVLFPLYDLSGMSFKIERKAEFGGDQEYNNSFVAKKIGGVQRPEPRFLLAKSMLLLWWTPVQSSRWGEYRSCSTCTWWDKRRTRKAAVLR